jgi:molybdopterin-guanine dinucleotide biosynthesis protein A
LAGHCREARGVVPRIGRRLEPLAAIYPKAATPLALDLLRRQLRAASGFAELCQQAGLLIVRDVPEVEWASFANWNSPDDLAAPTTLPPHTPRRNTKAPVSRIMARTIVSRLQP